jgi:hypothetical protein
VLVNRCDFLNPSFKDHIVIFASIHALPAPNGIMETPSSLKGDTFATAAFRIYAQGWETPTDKVVSAREAASKLCELIVESSDAYGCIYGSIDALQHFACEAPSAIDYGLDVVSQAAAKLPDSIEHNYGKGAQGVINILKWYLVEFSTFFQGNVPPFGIGKETTDDRDSHEGSNITFSRPEVSKSKPVVLRKLYDFQRARLGIIVLLAMQARCHSKGLACLNRGEHVGDHAVVLIRNALNPLHEGTPRWSKVDFIACCILLRGCAKSLIGVLPTELRDSTVANWNEGFTAFLHSDEGTKNLDDDFVVKIHAAVRCNASGGTQLSLMCILESPRKPEQRSS